MLCIEEETQTTYWRWKLLSCVQYRLDEHTQFLSLPPPVGGKLLWSIPIETNGGFHSLGVGRVSWDYGKASSSLYDCVQESLGGRKCLFNFIFNVHQCDFIASTPIQ